MCVCVLGGMVGLLVAVCCRFTWTIVVGSRYDPESIEVSRRDTGHTSNMAFSELVAAAEGEESGCE